MEMTGAGTGTGPGEDRVSIGTVVRLLVVVVVRLGPGALPHYERSSTAAKPTADVTDEGRDPSISLSTLTVTKSATLAITAFVRFSYTHGSTRPRPKGPSPFGTRACVNRPIELN